MSDPRRKRCGHLTGVGFDHDGHTRITNGKDFTLRGGSQETHERMQEVAIRVSEEMKKQGTTIADAHPEKVRDAIMRAEERTGD
jgi:hypothetical protein